MIKEVEFSNRLEIITPGNQYSDGPGQSMFEGVLMDDGKTLDITVATPVPTAAQGVRKLLLYYCNIDFDSTIIDYTLLGETDFDTYTGVVGEDTRVNRVYTFDLSKVLVIPKKIYNTQGTSELTIQLYTYEANLSTDYGSKRLSVPYTISNSGAYEYDSSTDGIFKLILVDFPLWYVSTQYSIGDIVTYDGGIYIALENTVGVIPTSSTVIWGVPTEDDITQFIYGTTTNPPLNAVISDVMITRYAKYKYILETLFKVGFKAYDDMFAYELSSYMQMLRESALFSLLDNKPIEAAYKLQKLKRASGANNKSSKVKTFDIKYTI